MSVSLSAIVTFPYQGTPYSVPVSICGRASRVVPINIDWNTYWQLAGNTGSVAVALNLDAGRVPASGGVLDAIKAVKIDNTNSTVPIYVWFPDTFDTVTCPPQTVATLPVLTGTRQAVIATQGLTAGSIPQTKLFFVDTDLLPLVDPALQISFPQHLGSPLIQRNQNNILTPGYGPPALGDQTFNLYADPSTTDNFTCFATPRANGFIYVTNYNVRFTNQTGRSAFLTFESTGASGVYFTHYIPNVATSNAELATYGNMNLKLDATELWRFHYAPAVGAGNIQFAFNIVYTFNER